MKITVTKNIRNLKEGTVYDFSELKSTKHIVIVGDNGCGKSTLLQALRGHMNSKKTGSLYEHDFQVLSKNFEFEHDYDKIYHFDRIKDNGSDMNNAYDAITYLDSGGFMSKNLSHGQSSMMYLNKFIEDITPILIKDEKVLFVFDEIDNGMSISYLSKFSNLIRILALKYNVHLLVISHNPFLINDFNKVFDMSRNKMVLSKDFLKEKTGYELSFIGKNDKIEE